MPAPATSPPAAALEPAVTRGLDHASTKMPEIGQARFRVVHLRKFFFAKRMDCRVEPGNDNLRSFEGYGESDGYARAARQGIEASPGDVRWRRGRAAHDRVGRVRRAAAEHDQRLRLRRHLEPSRAAAQDEIAGRDRHD